jgi:hypothetical protein
MPMANRNQKILIIVSSCCLEESFSWQDSRFQAENDFKLGFFHGSRPVKSTSGETT